MGEIRESGLSPILLFILWPCVGLINFLAFGYLTWDMRMLVSKISSFLLGLKILSLRGLLLPFRPMLEVIASSKIQVMIYGERVQLSLVLKNE